MIDLFFGIVQGITEFLPISSSGHLVILSELFNSNNLSTYVSNYLQLPIERRNCKYVQKDLNLE